MKPKKAPMPNAALIKRLELKYLPMKARYEAAVAGKNKYQCDPPCRVCGGTVWYTINKSCVMCKKLINGGSK